MGAGNSVPLWLNPDGNPSNYDMWGFVPDGMTPPQHVTSQMYDIGFPASSPLLTSGYQQSGNTQSTTVLWVGQQNDMLDNFSVNVSSKTTNLSYGGTNYPVPEYADVYASAPGGPWAPDNSSTGPTCDPSNYPDCYLSSMRAAAPIFKPYSTWWSSEAQPTYANGNFSIQLSPPGPLVPLMDRYVQKIDEHVAHYAAGRYDGLKDVCTQDTSNYDPCTTGFFEKILPFLLGFAGVALLKTYGSEALAFLPAQSNGYLYATAFFTLYHVGAGVEAFSLGDTGDWEADTAAAANSLAMGIGAIVASYQLQSSAYVLPLSIGAALVARMVLGGALYRALVPVVAGTGVLSALPMLILHFIEKFFCWISNWGMTACDDFGENSGFPSARRWDVPSLAAKLTDIACDSEGWDRDSEQAKFVYRGLVTNPSWMTAATNAVNMAAGNTLWDGKHQVNPLGIVGPLHEVGYTGMAPAYTPPEWAQHWTHDQWLFTGNEQGGTVDPVTETNRFACQNFDVLYWADECGFDDDPECQGPNPPARCQHKCAENPNQEGSDVVLATNMKTWLKRLVEGAYDPSKITEQFSIPGLDNKALLHLPGLYDVAEYLRTCANDFDGTGKTGFNDVTQRGKFANFYLTGKVYGHIALQDTELAANNFFSAFHHMAAAWDWVLHNWNRRNATAYAHYIYREKGPIQQASFELWENGYTEVRKWKDDPFHPNEGFTGDPRSGLKLLPPAIEHTLPGLAKLQPLAPKELGPRGPLQYPFRTDPEGTVLQRALEFAERGDYSQASALVEGAGYPEGQFAQANFETYTVAAMLALLPYMPNYWTEQVALEVQSQFAGGGSGGGPAQFQAIFNLMQPTGPLHDVFLLLPPADQSIFVATPGAPYGKVQQWLYE